MLEALDHNIEDLDFEPMDTEPVTCLVCGELLDHADMVRAGARHPECVPEWVSGRLRHGYRRRG
jgi:hypothetical protein